MYFKIVQRGPAAILAAKLGAEAIGTASKIRRMTDGTKHGRDADFADI